MKILEILHDAKIVLVDLEVIDYVIKRMDRSFEAIKKLVSKIDFEALEKSKRITIPFIKQIIKL